MIRHSSDEAKKGSRGRRSARIRSRDELKSAIENSLRREFPTDTVDVSDGYKDNIHVMVISRKFDSMSDTVREDYLRTLLDDSDLTEAEKRRITVLLTWSPAELK